MSDQGWAAYARGFVEDSLASGEGWPDIVTDPRAEGLEDEVIASVFREHQAWTAEAREWKEHGFSYEEIVLHLREEVAAGWGDVARALMEVGLSPADMLRAVLPSTEGEECLPVIQAGLLDGPSDADYQEAHGVLMFCFRNIQSFQSNLYKQFSTGNDNLLTLVENRLHFSI